ncbi:MAG: DUF4124 domain-containing protein [Proteobacteria bacterium]|nr:DUF4124 domain-containing protein [Pseudomonadota bacterium]
MRHHSPAPVRPLIGLLVAIGLLAGSLAMAETVYKWKDANGQSHYSQQPPDGVKKYETITSAGTVDTDDANSPATPASGGKDHVAAGNAASSATPAQQQRTQLCKQARDNVDTLNQHATVTTDLNGDGKPVTLNAAQHDKALSDAKKQVDLYCAQ